MRGQDKWPVLLSPFVLMQFCAAGSFPDYPVRPTGDYPNSAVSSGLTIAVHPIEDVKEQRTYFGTNLASKGYLPVLIVMQNASTDGSFLVKRDAIAYRVLPGTESATSKPEIRSTAGPALGIASGTVSTASDIASTIAAQVPLPLPTAGFEIWANPLGVGVGGNLAALRLISNATQVQQNILTKGLQSRTLSPGGSAHGFLYVRVPKGSARQKIHLRIPVAWSASGDTLDFDLLF
jgi:hypothetical protein